VRDEGVHDEGETLRLGLDELRSLAFQALVAVGCSTDQADAIAETVTRAEGDGARSHGLFRIPFYARVIRETGAVPDARPVLRELAPGVVQVDGGMGFAPLALRTGLPELVRRARAQGIAALALRNVFHIAALWHEVEELTSEGLVGLAFTASISHIPPAGGRRPLYGTNPMAFGWPRLGEPPVIFDQASSASARGEILLHQRAGTSLPEGWAVGPDGTPTTDPTEALAGAQLPFGGYKGASIALMVELLAGALIGDLFSFESAERDRNGIEVGPGGELLVAIDPSRFLGEGGEVDGGAGSREGQVWPDQAAHAERLFRRILDDGEARLPGQRRYETRARSEREGVEVPSALVEEVRALAKGG
jgi:delta1-piperideine-2-carboxylate reductase